MVAVLHEARHLMEAWCVGVIDGISFVGSSLSPPYASCLPKGVTNEQLKRVVVAYMNARPERLHYPFKVLVIEALATTWPCNQQQPTARR